MAAQRRVELLCAHLVGGDDKADDGYLSWGASEGYPSTPEDYVDSSGGSLDDRRSTRVHSYSGGYEKMFPFHEISAGDSVSPLSNASHNHDFTFRYGSQQKKLEEYFKAYPVTGMVIARKGKILVEHYCHERNGEMRMQSWSMAKSVTSLLLGICVDRGLISSIDDTAEKYVPELEGTLHGRITLRNLGNMSSGAKIEHASQDYAILYPKCFTARGSSDISPVVAGWNTKEQAQGEQFNYNELCPLAVGMVIRKVTGKSLSAFAEEALWRPLGAEASATWTTDSKGVSMLHTKMARFTIVLTPLPHVTSSRS
jgi:hypothetical protein